MAYLYLVQTEDYRDFADKGTQRDTNDYYHETFELPNGELASRMREFGEKVLAIIREKGTFQPGAGTLGFNQLIVGEEELREFMSGSPFVQVRANTSVERIREAVEVALHSYISDHAHPRYFDPVEKEIWATTTDCTGNIRKQILEQRKARAIISVHLSTSPQKPEERVQIEYWKLPVMNRITY